MASLSPEEKVEFLIQLLVTGEFTPNYGALAKRMGINNNSNTQRRLKSIVEADNRFTLRSSGGSVSIVESGQEGDSKDDSESAKKTTPSTRGRKRNKSVNRTEDSDGTPSKAAKKVRTVQIEEDGEGSGYVGDGLIEQSQNQDVA